MDGVNKASIQIFFPDFIHNSNFPLGIVQLLCAIYPALWLLSHGLFDSLPKTAEHIMETLSYHKESPIPAKRSKLV